MKHIIIYIGVCLWAVSMSVSAQQEHRHSDCLEDGEKWLEMVREKFPEAASVTLQELGPTIACHVGPGFLSIVYMADHRKEF